VCGCLRYDAIKPFGAIFQGNEANVNHLHRYLAEFDFRYSNRVKLGVDDTERTRRAIKGAGGKRLTYRRTRSQAEETGAA
jgi:hypothetical protein